MIVGYTCLRAIEMIEKAYISVQALVFYLFLIKTSNIIVK
jgi:hypothetical protein